MNELTTMISDLGVPVAVTCASGALVYFLLNWVKSTLIGTIKSMGDEIEEELAKNEKILVRLIDKVNLLHWSTDVLLRNFYINQERHNRKFNKN